MLCLGVLKEVEINLYQSVYHFSTFIVNPRNISVIRKFTSIHHILLLQLHHHCSHLLLDGQSELSTGLQSTHLYHPLYYYSYSFISSSLLFYQKPSFQGFNTIYHHLFHLLEIDGQTDPFHCTILSQHLHLYTGLVIYPIPPPLRLHLR